MLSQALVLFQAAPRGRTKPRGAPGRGLRAALRHDCPGSRQRGPLGRKLVRAKLLGPHLWSRCEMCTCVFSATPPPVFSLSFTPLGCGLGSWEARRAERWARALTGRRASPTVCQASRGDCVSSSSLWLRLTKEKPPGLSHQPQPRSPSPSCTMEAEAQRGEVTSPSLVGREDFGLTSIQAAL